MLQGVLQRGIDGYGRLRPLWTCWTVVALGILGLGLRAGSVLGNRFDCSRDGLGLGDRFSSSGGSILDGRPSWGIDISARGPFGDLGVVFMVFQVLYRYMAWSSHNSALVMVLEGLVAKEWS